MGGGREKGGGGRGGGDVWGGGGYSGVGELLFRVGNFAEKYVFSIEIGISHDDENGILASGSNVFQL